MNLDPLAEKYYDKSSYVYAFNNPMYYIDPDRERVWVYYQDADGNEQRAEYKENQLYSAYGNIIDTDGNDFLTNSLASSNKMSSAKNGALVLGDLMKSEHDFDLKSKGTGTADTAGFFANKDDEGNYIGGGTLALSGAQDFETVAHEFFHAYQYEETGDGYSITSEVEAYLFGLGVSTEYAFNNNELCRGIAGRPNAEGRLFETAADNLLWAREFDVKSFNTVVDNFKERSYKNLSGRYDKFPKKTAKNSKVIISKFFPLFN